MILPFDEYDPAPDSPCEGPDVPFLDPLESRPSKQAPLKLVPLMRKVENAAWKTVRKCLTEEERDSLCLPVPVERWIEGPLGLRLEIVDLTDRSVDGSEVLGATVISTKTIRVSDRIVNQENRFRFTLAHELGHITLHGHLSGKYRDSADGEFLSNRYEREADKFAAAFLAPANAFRQEFSRYAAQCGVDARELLERVSREDASATVVLLTGVIPKLAQRFGVAKTTALGRFRDLQLDGDKPMVPYRVLRTLQSQLVGKRASGK